jgi:UDP-N-acetylmuramate--alanine ligase
VAEAGTLDLEAVRRVHVTNVGGAGMSAVATVLAQMGLEVSGHDPAATTPFLEPLRAAGVVVTTGGDRPPLGPGVEALITSTATSDDDPDLQAAVARGVPVLHRSAALAAISARRRTAAVTGTHGKTTTAALLATALHGAGAEPGWIIGARVAGLGCSAAWGGDGPLVVEADESDGSFLSLAADAALVTNVEADHLEHWGSEAALVAGFAAFVGGVDGPVVVCADDPGSAALAHRRGLGRRS